MASGLFCLVFVTILAALIIISRNRMVAGAESSSRAQNQHNVVVALQNAGRFSMAASLLDSLDMDVLPASSTLFVPDDIAASKLNFKSFNEALPILEYHVLPRQLSFHDLLQFEPGTRLKTLLNENTILITNNGSRNYTIDDVRINRPDIYFDDTMVIHGIGGLLNSSMYGKNHVPVSPIKQAGAPSPLPILNNASPSPSLSTPSGSTFPTGPSMPVSSPIPTASNSTAPSAKSPSSASYYGAKSPKPSYSSIHRSTAERISILSGFHIFTMVALLFLHRIPLVY